MKDTIYRADAIARIANDNVVGGMERINEYNNSTEFNEYLYDSIDDVHNIRIINDAPSAEAKPTMTEDVREALMRLTMCAREECGMCKYKDECGFDFQYNISTENMHTILDALSAEAEMDGDMGEVSDGYHTFNQLYHQRAVLFATIVNQNKEKAWKSWKHGDGKFCFDSDKEWFIVGVDTPKGSYTYHYEKKYWDMFDCVELEHGKFWDGHTEEDVTRLLSLPSAEAVQGEWVRKYDDKVNCYWYECDQCGEYRPRNKFGHEYNANFCPNCGAKMHKGGEE